MTVAGLGTLFTAGRLDADYEQISDEDAILVAAATTFELAIQKLLIPYGCADGQIDVPPRVVAQLVDISKLLDPSTAPPIFLEANVSAHPGYVCVQFGPVVSVSLNTHSISMLRRFLLAHPDIADDPDELTDQQVVETVLSPFENGSAFQYD